MQQVKIVRSKSENISLVFYITKLQDIAKDETTPEQNHNQSSKNKSKPERKTEHFENSQRFRQLLWKEKQLTFWTRNINPHSLSTDAVQANEWFPAFPLPVSNFQHLQFFDFHIQVQIIFLNT